MRIVELKANNFKRLVAVDITPEGDLVLLSGKNSSGKTSVLDAIWAALGGARACPGKPIREGAEKGEVRLVLDNGLVVERTFTPNDSYLKVTSDDGRQKFTKPQDMLDALIGKIAFDPLAFARKRPKEQVVELLGVVDIGIDLDTHERERQALYDARADANKEVKRLEGSLAGQSRYDDAPAAIISANELAAELEELNAKATKATQAQAKSKELYEEIKEQRAKLDRLQAEYDSLQEDYQNVGLWDDEIASLRARLATVEADNEKVRANERYDQLAGELDKAKAVAADQAIALKLHDERKTEALEAAKFPVEGLSFDDEGVRLNGIPLAQCSSSEQLKVAVAIAMAANPDLRVIQIREGSLLDRESLDVIAELAGARDYQVWVEVVDETGEVGVVIEGGMVAGAPVAEEVAAHA
ncbi:MAG: AAA family ATPase [Candidatus Zixiibacteriota bacterium]|jgi:recombinational DNA repair ATPase RecF